MIIKEKIKENPVSNREDSLLLYASTRKNKKTGRSPHKGKP
jgi:hypothetical protein